MGFTDIAGQEIQVGDCLAVGMLRYRSAELRIGVITKLGPDKLGMVWLLAPREQKSENRYRTNTSSIEANSGRYLKITQPVDFAFPE